MNESQIFLSVLYSGIFSYITLKRSESKFIQYNLPPNAEFNLHFSRFMLVDLNYLVGNIILSFTILSPFIKPFEILGDSDLMRFLSISFVFIIVYLISFVLYKIAVRRENEEDILNKYYPKDKITTGLSETGGENYRKLTKSFFVKPSIQGTLYIVSSMIIGALTIIFYQYLR